MSETLLLISKRPEDEAFMKEASASSGFPLVIAPDVESAAEKAESMGRPIIFVDISNDTDYVKFYTVFEPLIDRNPSKYSSSFLHFFTTEEWKSLYDCARANTVGHLIFRNTCDPAIPGREYGRIVQAAQKGELFGLSNSLGPASTIKSIEIRKTTDKAQVLEKLCEVLEKEIAVSRRTIDFLSNATDELLMNAIYDAPAAATGIKDNMPRDTEIHLEGQHTVELQLGFNSDYIALSVVDLFGSLNRSKLLQHLLKSYRDNDYQIDPTVAGAGLGLAITLRTGASLLFATELGARTEATVMIRKVDNWREFKSQYRFVSINVRGKLAPPN